MNVPGLFVLFCHAGVSRDENGFGDVEGRIDELNGQSTRVAEDGQIYYEYELDAGRSYNLISATATDVRPYSSYRLYY